MVMPVSAAPISTGSVSSDISNTPVVGTDSIQSKKSSGNKITFYFRNANVYNSLTTSHYNSSFGTKSNNFQQPTVKTVGL